jgi:hypothetical protein
MSVGKLVPKGKTTIKGLVRGKEDAPIFLHITSSEQVGASPLPSLFVLPRCILFSHRYHLEKEIIILIIKTIK